MTLVTNLVNTLGRGAYGPQCFHSASSLRGIRPATDQMGVNGPLGKAGKCRSVDANLGPFPTTRVLLSKSFLFIWGWARWYVDKLVTPAI